MTNNSFNFVARVAALPIINTTLSTVHSVYDTTKNRYSLVGAAADTVESSAKFVFNKVNAVAQESSLVKQLPLASVDALACKGLDSIEALLPVIKEEPSVIYETTTKLPGVIYQNTTKLPGAIYQKATQVVDTNVVTPIAKTKANIETISSKAVDNALSFSEHLAENYLPVEETPISTTTTSAANGHANGSIPASVVVSPTARIVNLASNIKKGTYKKYQQAKAQGIKLKEPEERAKLSQQAISLVSYAKDVATGYGARAYKTLEIIGDSALQAAEAHPISGPYVVKGKSVYSSAHGFVSTRVQQVKDTSNATVNFVSGTAKTAKDTVVSTATFAYTSVTSVFTFASNTVSNVRNTVTSTVDAARARVTSTKDSAVKTVVGAPAAAYSLYTSFAPQALITLTDATYADLSDRFTGKLAQPIPEKDIIGQAVQFVGAPKAVYAAVDTARDVTLEVVFGVASRVGVDGYLKKYLPVPSTSNATGTVLVN